MEHHCGSTRWRTMTVQQDGAPLSCNKMARHYLSTRLRNMTVKQDGAPLSFNEMEHHCRSTRWRTSTFPHRSDAIFSQRYPKRELDVWELLSGPPTPQTFWPLRFVHNLQQLITVAERADRVVLQPILWNWSAAGTPAE